MKSFDVFAMSSVTEGLGSAMLEAMAASRAVVGTRAGGIPEAIVHEVTGLLVPTHDDQALASAIVALLNDPDRRRLFGAAGRARVIDEFSVDRMVQRTVAAYKRAVSGQRAEGKGQRGG